MEKEIRLKFVCKEDAARYVKMLLKSGIGTLSMKEYEDDYTCEVSYLIDSVDVDDDLEDTMKLWCKAIGIIIL